MLSAQWFTPHLNSSPISCSYALHGSLFLPGRCICIIRDHNARTVSGVFAFQISPVRLEANFAGCAGAFVHGRPHHRTGADSAYPTSQTISGFSSDRRRPVHPLYCQRDIFVIENRRFHTRTHRRCGPQKPVSGSCHECTQPKPLHLLEHGGRTHHTVRVERS